MMRFPMGSAPVHADLAEDPKRTDSQRGHWRQRATWMSQACRGIGAGSKIPPEPAQDKRRADARQFRCRNAATDGDVRF